MKNLKYSRSLLTSAVFGLAALVLRRWLYAVAVDEKGLLIAGHPLTIALWTAVLAGAVLILARVRKEHGSVLYEDSFSPSLISCFSHCFMAAAILIMVLNYEFPLFGIIGTIWKVLGFLTAPAMVWAGLSRKKGMKPFFGIHAALCLFLLLHLVSRYQGWSGNPQLQDYVFELLASVMLVLFSYYCAAFEAGMGNRRMQLATGLLTVLLCGAALALRTDCTGLYLSGALWAAADLCVPVPPAKQEEVENHDPA